MPNRILVKQIGEDLYFDSEKHWKKIGDRMYGFDPLRATLYSIWKSTDDFTILPSEKLKSTQISKRKEKKIVTDTSKIAPRDIDKPDKYITDQEKAYQSLVGGD